MKLKQVCKISLEEKQRERTGDPNLNTQKKYTTISWLHSGRCRDDILTQMEVALPFRKINCTIDCQSAASASRTFPTISPNSFVPVSSHASYTFWKRSRALPAIQSNPPRQSSASKGQRVSEAYRYPLPEPFPQLISIASIASGGRIK